MDRRGRTEGWAFRAKRWAGRAYDFALAWIAVAWLGWDELALHRGLGIWPGPWRDFLTGWGEELAREARASGAGAVRQEWLANLPALLEAVALAGACSWAAWGVRKAWRTTPGRWAVSGGWGKAAAALAGLAALALGWGAAETLWLAPV